MEVFDQNSSETKIFGKFRLFEFFQGVALIWGGILYPAASEKPFTGLSEVRVACEPEGSSLTHGPGSENCMVTR